MAGSRWCGWLWGSPDRRRCRPLRGRTTAWKEGATDGFTAELAATVDGGEPLAVVVLAAKSPPDPFGVLLADLADLAVIDPHTV
jgi:hypothetical protein